MANMHSLVKRYIDEEIRLSQSDISSSVSSREWFLERVKNKIEEDTSGPQLYKQEPFVYFGSYFKRTKVKNVDEFDVLVVMDSNNGRFTKNDTRIGDGIGSAHPNHKYDGKYKKSDGSGVSPAKLLNWLKSIVADVVETFGGEAPIRNGQAITARIKSKDLNIDLVPAGIFRHTIENDVIFYDIPEGDINNGWILTNPKRDMEIISNLSKDKSDLRNIIRLLKSIRDEYNLLITSFAIECCVVQYATNYSWSDDIYENLLSILKYFAKSLEDKAISDTFDSNNNLLLNVESTDWYAERVLKMHNNLSDLVYEENEDYAYRKMYDILKNN